MQRYYDMGFFLIAFSLGLYVGDWATDHDGTASILSELLFGIAIVAVCFAIDLVREKFYKDNTPS